MSLSVSYPTAYLSLKALADDGLTQVRKLARTHQWILIYDNINYYDSKFNQRLDNRNRHHEPFQHYAVPFRIRPISPLDVSKTWAFEIPAMDIDQSSLDGNMRVLEEVKKLLQLDDEWFRNHVVIVGGNQLTVSRVRTMIRYRAPDVSAFNRLQWAIPVLQLFHLQMIVCGTILRTHYGHITSPGSLAYNIGKLGRKRVDKTMPCYYTANELLRNTFDAMVRRMWLVELDRKRLDTLEDDVSGFWAGVDCYLMEDRQWFINHVLMTKARAIRDKYLANSATLSQTLGTANINAALFVRDMVAYMELSAAIKAGDIGDSRQS
ncbi:hypothetical protein KI688_004876 [Linnemannia hyalina]|uniref:DUF6589 domain-containing protein n=1 Tax=Linnemannia hyalina TaxID=64524 RepID=A0A9P7XLT8_9FUNG|nr:hypothetical protein KI688_004876 [Linnemannia hyalina]